MSLVENIKFLCALKGTSIPKLEKELGFGRGAIYNWDTNSPSIDKVQKVADYFEVSVDDLLGFLKTVKERDSMEGDFDEEQYINKLNADYYNYENTFIELFHLLTRVSYFVDGGKIQRFLPQYQKAFDYELKKLEKKYNIELGNTPTSVLDKCKDLKDRDITYEVLKVITDASRKVDMDIRYGKVPPPLPPDEIQTLAAHHDGEDWTEEELAEIERFKEFVRMKRKMKQQE